MQLGVIFNAVSKKTASLISYLLKFGKYALLDDRMPEKQMWSFSIRVLSIE